jgi:hypothetical protein
MVRGLSAGAKEIRTLRPTLNASVRSEPATGKRDTGKTWTEFAPDSALRKPDRTKALREGVPPRELKNIAPPDLEENIFKFRSKSASPHR